MPTLLYLIWRKTAQVLWLPRDQWHRRYKIRTDSIKFLTFNVILTLKTTIWFLNKTFQLMIMYHLIKFGCQKISSSADMAETVIFDCISPNCDPELEDSKPIFLHDTLAHAGACHSKFGYRRFNRWGDIVQMNIHKNSEPFLCPWPWPQLRNQIFSQDNPAYDDVPSIQMIY